MKVDKAYNRLSESRRCTGDDHVPTEVERRTSSEIDVNTNSKTKSWRLQGYSYKSQSQNI